MINLFINYYQDKNPERQKELDECLQRNIDNPLIDRIYIFLDSSVSLMEFKKITGEKIWILQPFLSDERPTFKLFFERINQSSPEGSINIISNSDIYFDETLELVKGIKENQCYALCRHDRLPDGSIKHWNHADSQDAWVFKGKIKEINADFGFAQPGNDNRLAYLIDEAGYQITNPSLSIRCIHLHNSGIRNYTPKDTVPGPYKLLPPIKLKTVNA